LLVAQPRVVLLLVAVLGHPPLLLQGARAFGVALLDHALLALAVAAELLRSLALGADAGFLLAAVQATRGVAAIVPARVVRRFATLRAGGVAADWLRALSLLALAQRALRILALRLRLHAKRVAAGAAARLLDAL